MILFILIFFIPFFLYSIENEEIINKIFIYGNIKTKVEIIERIINLKPGNKFDKKKIEKVIKKLKKSGLFDKVEVEIKKSEEGINIFIIVSEKSSLFFDLITVYSHEIYNNFWGMKTGLLNPFGINQKFELTGTIGNLKNLN